MSDETPRTNAVPASIRNTSRRCRACGQSGHYSNSPRCPRRDETSEREDPDLQIVDEVIEEIAQLRERQDALAQEIDEYERVSRELHDRIQSDRTEIQRCAMRIAHLRSKRR